MFLIGCVYKNSHYIKNKCVYDSIWIAININSSSMKLCVLFEDFLKKFSYLIISWTMERPSPPFGIVLKIYMLKKYKYYLLKQLQCIYESYEFISHKWFNLINTRHREYDWKIKSSSNFTKNKYKWKYLCKIDSNKIEVMQF